MRARHRRRASCRSCCRPSSQPCLNPGGARWCGGRLMVCWTLRAGSSTSDAGGWVGWASGLGLWRQGVAAGCGCGHVAARHHGAHHPHPLGRRRSRCRRRGRGGVLRHRRGGRGRAGGAGVLRAPARRRRPCRRCGAALLLAKAPGTGSASCEHTRESCGSGVACAHCAGVAEVSRALSRLPSTDVLAVLAIAPKGLAEGRKEPECFP